MKRIYEDLKKYFPYAIYSGKCELNAEVANSYLNWLWWIIEPVCFMLVYAFVFGVVFGATEQYYIPFIFIGISMWDFFNRMLTDSVKIVKSNKMIVSRVYIPKYVLLLTKMYINGFKMFISFLISFILLLFYRVPLTVQFFWIIPLLFVFFLITFGICTYLLHFGVYVEDLSNVLKIFLRLMFYATGIFYDVQKRVGKKLGVQVGARLVKYNPVAFILSSVREAVLYGQVPNIKWILIWLVLGLIIAWFGINLIYKNENSYVKVI